MPEAAIAPAPAAPTAPAQPAAPAAPPEPQIPSGIDAAMKEFDLAVRPKPKPEVKPPADKAPAKPDAAPPKPEPSIDDLFEKAPGKLKGEYFKFKREMQDKVSNYEKEIASYKARPQPKEGAVDPKVFDEYKSQLKELEQRLAASDYRQSNEFKTQFIDRWNSEYKASVDEVKQLMATVGQDVEGNPKTRPATEQDFQYIMRLPPGQQDQVITQLFGNYAPRIFQHLFRLQEIERASTQAVEQHAKTLETSKAEKEAMTAKEKSEYDQSTQVSNQELQTKWPQYFAPDEKDPEATEALANGYKFVDELISKTASLSPSDRAAYNAVLRARAAAFPRMAFQFNRLSEENAALKAELGKFRKSDPGSDNGGAGGGQAVPKPDDDIPAGIDAAVAKLKLQ